MKTSPLTYLLAATILVMLSGCTTLWEASVANDIAKVQSMINKGTKVDDANEYGSTALMAASKRGYTTLAQLLLDKGANVNSMNSMGDTPLGLATAHGHTEISRLLIENGANVNTVQNGFTALISASISGQTEIARLLIEKGADVNRVTPSGDSALTWSSFKGHTEIVKLLIGKGANVNIVTNNRSTPLVLAASQGRTEIAKLLIANGADVSARGEAGKTALEWAKERNQTETYNAIVEAQQHAIAGTFTTELNRLIANKDMQGLKTYLDAHPEALPFIKDAHLRLLYTGPSELRIIDVVQLVKNETKDALIIAQINGTAGPYKKFTVAEMAELKKMAISDEVVAAMIAITTEYNKEQKRAQANQTAAQPAQQTQQQPAQTQKVAEVSTPAECLKLVAAIKACDQTGGFLAMGCKAMAKSQFTCPIPVETLMR